jgi:GNAT superfamily N-acetyltransferase
MAAFYEKNTAKSFEQPTGGIGFFDCVNQKEAAGMLFDAGKKWLKSVGMEAMDGPVNFGTRDNFWGCLTDGFYEPVYNMPYNFPYYAELFESYGFKNYFNQYTYHMPLDPSLLQPVVHEKALRIQKQPGYRVVNYKRNELEKFTNDFVAIFNDAWGKFPGVKPMKTKQALAMFKALNPVLDPRIIYFEYYHDRPVAFFIMIPDLYQVIRYFNGKMNAFNKLRTFLFLRVLHKATRAMGVIFGVVPDFQGKGIEAAMITRFAEDTQKPGFNYTDLEMNWIGDFNPGMMKLMQSIGATIRKTHVTYRYLFDENKPFKRAKLL